MSYRRGIVTEVDVSSHRLRAQLPDRDGMVTGWLDVLVSSASTDKVARLPAPGNQVAVLLDENDEAGCVLGALYSKADPVPEGMHEALWRIEFRDGGVIEYDADAGIVRLTPPSGGAIELAGNSKSVALAEDVRSELDAIKSELQSIASGVAGHTHPFVGVAPTMPAVTSSPLPTPYTPAYNPSDVAAAQVKSA